MINNKLSSTKTTLAIVIVVALGLLAYFIMPKNSLPVVATPTPSPIITPVVISTLEPTVIPTPTATIIPTPTVSIDIASWKTYSNDKFVYSIKYPVGWYLYSDNSSDIFIQPQDIKNIPADSAPGQHASAFEIIVIPVKAGATLLQLIKSEFNQAGIDFTQESVTIGGVQGLRVVSVCDGIGCGLPEWFVIRNNYLYHFNSNLGYSEIFDKILSTFKFTN